VNWIAGRPEEPFEAEVKIRYRGEPAAAVVAPEGGDRATVEFRAPQRAVTPGQSVVFYSGDEVLGGGTITSALR
jgi:tRNA-specific 2-thiouridylase